jgi:CMP-N-acetylneuraminic acid synthetase
MAITVFLPCRKGSQRIPNKNIKPFAGYEMGLLELKISQLLAVNEIDQIVLSSNDEAILDYGYKLANSRLKVHERDNALGSNETSTDDVIRLASSLIGDGDVLWTHVTSPFFGSADYVKAIKTYNKVLDEGYDSLMSVSVVHGFLWNKHEAINYDRNIEKWPRTQTIEPLFEINSALFLSSSKNYQQYQDRIGQKPFLFETEKICGFDIDWPDDFLIAESIASSGVVNL